MNFSSDNWAGATVPVMAALTRHSTGLAPAYGTDPLTEEISARFSELFETDVAVFFVSTGSAANSLALSAFAKPGGAIFCHRDAHIQVDECGAPEFLTNGGKLVSVPGTSGKMTSDALRQAMSAFPDGVVHHGQVASVSITQPTECGTLYTLDEIRQIKAVADERGVPLHMDGARFANALVSLGCTPADLTWKSGVDVLSFGGTKNGCWCAEVIVFFDPKKALGFEYFRKRAGHLFSKNRFVAAQLEGYFENDAWLDSAAHSNDMAVRLAEGIRAAGGRTAWPVEANEVFPILPKDTVKRLQDAGALFYEWPTHDLPDDIEPSDTEVCVRLVASFATQASDVDCFLELLKL